MQQTEQTNPYTVYQPAYTPKPDTVYTKTMKEHFSFFGIGSLLYAIFYTFCLYKNASGITYPFFVAGTLFYFFFSMQKLGVPYKKSSIFYLVSIQLLGSSKLGQTQSRTSINFICLFETGSFYGFPNHY